MSTWLYRAEAKGIQSWILQSNKLRELKGGSRIIDELTGSARELLAQVLGGDEAVERALIVSAAGNLEIEFPTESQVRRFAAAWPLAVDAQAPGLTLIQAWIPSPTSKEEEAELYRRLGMARNLIEVDLPSAGPLVARAGRTGLPAVRSGKEGLLDRALARKMAQSKESEALARLAPEGWSFMDDNSELGSGTEENYLAVIHADGNKVGLAVQDLSGPALKEFARALATVTHEAATAAFGHLSRHISDDDDRKKKRLLPARPVVVGGDDFTAIVDGHHALAFTHFYLRAFSRLAKKHRVMPGDEPLTSSAGVAFVKTSFPFDVAHEIAESLCKAAKKQVTTGSGLLFHRVTTASTHTAWSDIKQTLRGKSQPVSPSIPLQERSPDDPSCRPPPEPRFVTFGAYTLEQMSHLEDLALALRPLPRKSMREWIALALDDHHRAQSLMSRTEEVADPAAWDHFQAALHALGHEPTGWTKDGRTAIPDALTWRSLTPGTAHRLWSHE